MKIYCSGIGGIGLSAYAALQNAEGHLVRGSDRAGSALIEDLLRQGIEVNLNQDGAFLPDDTDLFVYSEAIPDDAPERVKARQLGIKSISYFQALGEYLTERNLTVIAICGTHGKSSTTAMAAKVFVDAGKDPTVVVGTKVQDLDGRNWRKGESTLAIIEACEYRGSFLHLSPSTILMTNVDGDHFDVYPSIEAYQQSFVEFAKKLPSDGVLVTHESNADCRRVAEATGKRVVDADLSPAPELGPAVPGEHMQQNAALVVALSQTQGIAQTSIESSLKKFRGTWRRMERKGTLPGDIQVIDDYAHHPREISATIQAMKSAYPDRRIVCLFQPHLRSRTHQFYKEFTEAFHGAQVVLLTDPYEARSDASDPIDMKKFADDITSASQVESLTLGSLADAERKVQQLLSPHDLLIVMGAGSIGDVAERLLQSPKSV